MSTDPDRPDSQDGPAGPARPATPTTLGAGAGADLRRSAASPATPVASAADAWRPDEPAFEARVVRAFIRGGRLTSIPARERKKLVIYRYLLDQVLPDPAEAVAERDLNMRLALWHPDPATIRRAFIDHRLATRDGMTYRRAAPARLGVPPGE